MSCSKVLRQNFVKKWPCWTVKIKKRLRIHEGLSSAYSNGLDIHILFLEPFRHSYIVLNLAGDIYVTTSTWASAFEKFSIESCAKILCKEVFTEEELEARNERKNISALPNFKRDAVKRATLWMMNKNQNPWGYIPSNSEISLSPEQEDALNKAFQTFATVSVPKYKPEEEPFSSNPKDQEEAEERKNFDNCLIMEFQRVLQDIKCGIAEPLGNLAQVVENLTIIAVGEELEDTFVGPVQFSEKRWIKALQSNGIRERAEVLFRKYLCSYYESKYNESAKTFPGFENFCSIIRVSIFQAVAFLKSDLCFQYKGKFDSSVPEHNLFLTESEIEEITKYIDSKYKISQDLMDFDEIMNNLLESPQTTNTPSTSQYCNVEQFQTLQIQKESMLCEAGTSAVFNCSAVFSSSVNQNGNITVPDMQNMNVPSTSKTPLSLEVQNETTEEARKAKLLADIPRDSKTGNYVFGQETLTLEQFDKALGKFQSSEKYGAYAAGGYVLNIFYNGQYVHLTSSGRRPADLMKSVKKTGKLVQQETVKFKPQETVELKLQKTVKLCEKKGKDLLDVLRYLKAMAGDGQLQDWTLLESPTIIQNSINAYKKLFTKEGDRIIQNVAKKRKQSE